MIKTAGPAAGSTVITGLSDDGPIASVSARGRVAGLVGLDKALVVS